MTDYGVLFSELAVPRLVGTPNHAKVREILARELAARGLVVEEHAFTGRSARTLLGVPRVISGVNLIGRPAVRPSDRPTVWLVAHYDSKGQPISMMARLAGFTLLMIGALALVIDFMTAVVMLGLGLVVVAQNRVTDNSPGALDNASGCATVLEIAREARRLKPQPKRSMLFLMVTAEEQGLLGSQYYADFPLYPLEKTVANINIDGVNQWGRTKDLTLIGLGASDLDDYARDAAAEQGRVLRPDAEPEKGFYYRSDHFNFAKKGVPALDPDAGIDFIGKPADYGKKKRDEFTNTDYHQPSDQIKPDWDLTGAAEDAKLFLAIGYRVAQADKYPEWKPGNEFKAIRDTMLKKAPAAPREDSESASAGARASGGGVPASTEK